MAERRLDIEVAREEVDADVVDVRIGMDVELWWVGLMARAKSVESEVEWVLVEEVVERPAAASAASSSASSAVAESVSEEGADEESKDCASVGGRWLQCTKKLDCPDAVRRWTICVRKCVY